MIGKILTGVIVLVGIATAIAVYYFNVYYYYEEVQMADSSIMAETTGGQGPTLVPAQNVHAIDAESSPIRFRACFTSLLPLDTARETLEPYPSDPLNAPGWFGCFDAGQIGAALEAGRGATFLGEKNISYGVDRVIAILDDGRGYIWHQLNNCGDVAYDGSPVGEACPPRED